MPLQYIFTGLRERTMSETEDEFEDAYEETEVSSLSPLPAIADAFEDLSVIADKYMKNGFSGEKALALKPFCDACSLVSVLFGCLGFAFKFAEMEYCSKVQALVEASDHFNSLSHILDIDVMNDTVRVQGSLSRNLRRVRQGLDLIRAIFENFLNPEFLSLKDAATTAYADVCAPYHTWAIRTAVYAGMCALPSREQLLQRLNESDESAERQMRRYIKASIPVIDHIDKLFLSREITLDW